MVHKTTEFKPEEMDGAMEALHLCEAVDLIQVVEDVGWRGVRIEGHAGQVRGKPTAYPVSRGTVIGIPWNTQRSYRRANQASKAADCRFCDGSVADHQNDR